MLTLHKDTLHIDWPFGVKENITITEDEQVHLPRLQDTYGHVLTIFLFLGHHHQGVLAFGAHRYCLGLLFLRHYPHSVYCHVVPSHGYHRSHFSLD